MTSIWSESAQCFRDCKIPRARITPMGTAWDHHACANDHDVAHRQVKTVLLNLIWSEFARWLLSSGVHKIQLTTTIHSFNTRRFQWIWFGVNPLSGCGLPASAMFQGRFLHSWARGFCPGKQMTMMSHIYRPRWFQLSWLWGNRLSDCWVTASANLAGWTDRRADWRMDTIPQSLFLLILRGTITDIKTWDPFY